MIRTGVIGYGYWGPRIVRNLHSTDGCQVTTICDKSAASLQRAKRDCPWAEVTSDCAQVLTSPDIDAVAIVTPVWTHFELAKSALKNGKHVFVEKPFTSYVRAGRGTDQSGGAEEPADHGGSHLPVHRRGERRSGS